MRGLALHLWLALRSMFGFGAIAIVGSLLIGGVAAAQEVQPNPGERIRVDLSPAAVTLLSLTSPWEGSFVMVQERALVVEHPNTGAMRLPVDAIQSLQVERARSRARSVGLGAGAGAAFGVGMWQFLAILCGAGCDAGDASTWAPATAAGLVVGWVVGVKASRGRHWVNASVPR